MGPWLQLTSTTDSPVLVNFARVTRIEPSSGLLGKADRTRLHFGPGTDETSTIVEEGYDEVTRKLHAALHGEAEG